MKIRTARFIALLPALLLTVCPLAIAEVSLPRLLGGRVMAPGARLLGSRGMASGRRGEAPGARLMEGIRGTLGLAPSRRAEVEGARARRRGLESVLSSRCSRLGVAGAEGEVQIRTGDVWSTLGDTVLGPHTEGCRAWRNSRE